jgi:hypothetical protein
MGEILDKCGEHPIEKRLITIAYDKNILVLAVSTAWLSELDISA